MAINMDFASVAFDALKTGMKDSDRSYLGKLDSGIRDGIGAGFGLSDETSKLIGRGALGAVGIAGGIGAANLAQNNPIAGTALGLGLAAGAGYASLAGGLEKQTMASVKAGIKTGMKDLSSAVAGPSASTMKSGARKVKSAKVYAEAINGAGHSSKDYSSISRVHTPPAVSKVYAEAMNGASSSSKRFSAISAGQPTGTVKVADVNGSIQSARRFSPIG